MKDLVILSASQHLKFVKHQCDLEAVLFLYRRRLRQTPGIGSKPSNDFLHFTILGFVLIENGIDHFFCNLNQVMKR